MPTDAKLGLVCGVALVIMVAIIFFRKDAPAFLTGSDPAAIVKPTPPEVVRPEQPVRRPEWSGRTTGRQKTVPESETTARR